MGTIDELNLRLVRKANSTLAKIFLPEDFPFSAQTLSDTLAAIRNLFGDDAWGSMAADFNEEAGAYLSFHLPRGKEEEYLEVVRNATLPLAITQPESDKARLKLLAIHDKNALIEPSQVITSAQIRELIRTQQPHVQEVANGHWGVWLVDGYLKLHTLHRHYIYNKLDFNGVLTTSYPYVTKCIDAYIDVINGKRVGSMHLRVKLENRGVTLSRDLLDAAAAPGFSNIESNGGEVTTEYAGPEVCILDPIEQGTALKEIILDFILKLGIFPVNAMLRIGLPVEPDGPVVATIRFPFGTIAGRYPLPN